MIKIHNSTLSLVTKNNAQVSITISDQLAVASGGEPLVNCRVSYIQNFYWGITDLEEFMDLIIRAREILINKERTRKKDVPQPDLSLLRRAEEVRPANTVVVQDVTLQEQLADAVAEEFPPEDWREYHNAE